MVDILPTISPTGNFKKISDSSTYNNNNKVSTLFNVLEFCEGKNSLYPEMGVYKLLNSIPYSENPEAIVNQISSTLSRFLDFTVEVDYAYADETKETIEISLRVVGLPGIVKVSGKKTNETIKLINPRYFK
jgi:hypothetical protein